MNLAKEKSKIPLVIEESVYHQTRQYLLERLEAVRSWPTNEVEGQR